MAQPPLRFLGPGLGRDAAPATYSPSARKQAREQRAPATAAQRELFARARPAAVEIPAALLTGLLADIPAGLTGLATAPFQGAEKAAQNVQAAQEALTYAPRGQDAAQALQAASPAMERVGDLLRAPADWVADTTGSPALAAAAATAPDAAAELLGAGFASRAVRQGPSLARRAANLAARYPAVPLAGAGAAAGGLLDDEAGAALGGATGAALGSMSRVASRAGGVVRAGVPRSQRGIFAGFEAAEEAPREALALAEKMATDGRMSQLEVGSAPWHELNQRIHEATGRQFGAEGAVHFGVDMLPRWEISDRAAMTAAEDPTLAAPYVGARTWRDRADYLRHTALDAAYPSTRTMPVGWRETAPGADIEAGYVGPDQGTTDAIEMDAPLRTPSGAPSPDPRLVMLHELQHAVQSQERFGRGASPAQFEWRSINPMAQYARVAGEAEARATEARNALSSVERAQRYPFLDYSLPAATPGGVDWARTTPVPLDRRWWNESVIPARSPGVYGLFD